MASPNPRKEAPVTPGPPRFTFTTSPDQIVDRSMSSTVIPDMQPQSSFSKITPSESDFCVPDNTEEFWADNLRQARKKIAQIQATVDGNVGISTHNLLVSGLEKKEIQQLLQKKHSGSRATFTDEQVLFQTMPGNAHEQLIVFLQQNFARAMEAANCQMTRSTWVGIGATSSKGRFCGKEPDWGGITRTVPRSLSSFSKSKTPGASRSRLSYGKRWWPMTPVWQPDRGLRLS
ncbi:hypothetical protein N7519_009557 [Penicillium mononematosum]|uniref:uncharacterized protein n=1 Tax=Penicillium mononematosum TaxID=268346 RepID=UPI0025490FB6|nr:uncharacterized protein N7519_009557 [Penicillium mononematosum]KAJ6179096.1 hypothetical protein N7519_009557 [Penicillium mononematosum]